MGPVGVLREVCRYRHLLLALSLANFKIRYRNAVLGIGWSLAIPLALLLVFVFVFKPIFRIEMEHYGLFLLAALFPWTFLSASIGETINLLPANATFIGAHRFPREVLPLSAVLTQFVNLLFALGLLLIYVVAGPIGPTRQLLWLPLLVGQLVLFTAGLCLLFSALDACYKDVSYLVEVGMLAWFFLTPIFYPMKFVGERIGATQLSSSMWLVIAYNPLTPIVEGFRNALLGRPPERLLYPTLIALCIFLLGVWAFRRLEDRYVDTL